MRQSHWIIKKMYSILKNYYKNKDLTYFVTKELVFFFLKKNLIFINKKETIPNQIYLKIKETIMKITKLDMPYQYALETTSFLNTTILLIPPIFIPRNETESLVSFIQESLSSIKYNYIKIVDFCTGTGCIGIAMLKFFEKAHCDAFDINSKAVSIAAKNATLNSVRNRYTVFHKDIFLLKKCKKYDIIIGNPPYIALHDYLKLDPSVKKWESRQALTDEKNGYDIVLNLLKIAKKRINKQGIISFEICQSYAHLLLKETKKLYPKELVFLWHDQYNKKRAIIIAKGDFINFFKNKVYKNHEL